MLHKKPQNISCKITFPRWKSNKNTAVNATWRCHLVLQNENVTNTSNYHCHLGIFFKKIFINNSLLLQLLFIVFISSNHFIRSYESSHALWSKELSTGVFPKNAREYYWRNHIEQSSRDIQSPGTKTSQLCNGQRVLQQEKHR